MIPNGRMVPAKPHSQIKNIYFRKGNNRINIDANAKYCHLKKLTSKGTLGREPHIPLPHCIHTVRVYSYRILIYKGKGGGGELNQIQG
jgi:hypothetical protein